jgi:transposase
MDPTPEMRDLIIRTARLLPVGAQRRRYLADTITTLRLGQRQAQQLFGWGRDTIRKALRERQTGLTCVDAFGRRGRKPAEAHLPRLLQDIKDIVQDHVQTDPTFQTTRLYCRLTAAAVRRQLISRKGYTDTQLPKLKTITDKLNALGFRLRKVAKCRPQKK